MKTLTTLTVAFLASPLWSQIVIGSADMPSAGDIMTYRTATATGVSVAQTGANMTWDYSTLAAGTLGADTAVTVGSTPALYQFFFNNQLFYPDHAANFALKGQGLGVQGVNITNVFDYYKKDASGYRNVGFGANINGLPASVQNIPVDWIHRFPMEYGDQDTSFSEFGIGVPTLGYYGRAQWRYNHVDGWGTVVLPGGQSYTALRVRSVLDRRDTVYVDQFSNGFAFNEPQVVEYKWVAQGMDAPVLIITTVAGAVTTARYHADPLSSVGSELRDVQLLVYPVPATQDALVHLPEGWAGHLVAMDATGRQVAIWMNIRGGNVHRLDVSSWPNGVYALQLTGGEQVWSGRLVVEH